MAEAAGGAGLLALPPAAIVDALRQFFWARTDFTYGPTAPGGFSHNGSCENLSYEFQQVLRAFWINSQVESIAASDDTEALYVAPCPVIGRPGATGNVQVQGGAPSGWLFRNHYWVEVEGGITVDVLFGTAGRKPTVQVNRDDQGSGPLYQSQGKGKRVREYLLYTGGGTRLVKAQDRSGAGSWYHVPYTYITESGKRITVS